MAGDVPPIFDPAEDCPWRSPREIFAERGYVPLAPEALDDLQIKGRLWELLYAAAARRIFFCFTNHLSDRELYTLLWEEWLDEPTADIPLEAETNTRLIVSEFDAKGLTAEEIFLRYYADEDDHELFQHADPGLVLPPHEEPPFDRDRFLPIPLMRPQAEAEPFPSEEDIEADSSGPEPGEDAQEPLEGLAVDSGTDELTEAELEAQLQASEPENWKPPANTLVEENVPLLPPAEITPGTVTPIVWELLHNLALRGFYVSHTNHLSDEEVYAELWHHGLREPAMLPGRNPNGGWFHDFLGSWGDEEMQLWLKFYATEEERQKHSAEYSLPPAEKPAFNRDWRLPQGPFT